MHLLPAVLFAIGFIATVSFSVAIYILRHLTEPETPNKYRTRLMICVSGDIAAIQVMLIGIGLRWEAFFDLIMPLYIGLPVIVIGLLAAGFHAIKMYLYSKDRAYYPGELEKFFQHHRTQLLTKMILWIIIAAIGVALFFAGIILHGIFYGPMPPN